MTETESFIQSLVDVLGVEGALAIARENRWDGVVVRMLEISRHYSKKAPEGKPRSGAFRPSSLRLR